MDVQTILSVAVASLVIFVIAHFAVFWVVKTMYPPKASEPHVTFAEPLVAEPPQVLTAPSVDIQHVTVPTNEAPVPAKTANEEGERRGPPPPESTSIRREPGMAATDAQ